LPLQILDVGCGDSPQGTVNCDLNVGQTLEGGDQKQGITINPQQIPNFVKCSGLQLPFREGSFEEVVCFHVIEHTTAPSKLLKELVRAARRRVTVICPHRFSKGAKMLCHRSFLSKTWFRQTLKNFHCDITVNYETWPVFFVGFMRIKEIVVEISLDKNTIR